MKNVSKAILIAIIILMNLTACQKTEINKQSSLDEGLYEREYILNIIESSEKIDWKTEGELDPLFLYSIGMYTDSTFIVGYKPSSVNGLSEMINQFKSSPHSWLEEKEEVLKIFSSGDPNFVNLTPVSKKNISPFLYLKTSSFDVIKQLAESPLVYSIEPSGELFLTTNNKEYVSLLNNAGCRCNVPEISGDDLLDLDPNESKKPWNYEKNGIHENGAWILSQGNDIGVAVLDSGVSINQENLDNDGDFEQGLSVDRYEDRINFLGATLGTALFPNGSGGFISRLIEVPGNPVVIGPHDRCGHGTRMAGMVAAPRGIDNNVTGIAYNCDLYNYRVVHNPLILTGLEKLAVEDGLLNTILNNNIRIISMSIAQLPPYQSPNIEYAIDAAAIADKLIICAAGTSPFTGTLLQTITAFPATSAATIGTTGIKEPTDWDGSPLGSFVEACNICHYDLFGTVDFAVIIQDNSNNNRTTLALTCDGDIPDYASGSSSSTASVSAIAALIWAQDVTQSRDDVILKMVQASSNSTLEHGKFGWGVIDVYDALQ